MEMQFEKNIKLIKESLLFNLNVKYTIFHYKRYLISESNSIN